jgi:phosphohistidine phosphatase SixA
VKDEKRPIDRIGEEQSHDVGRALAAIGAAVNVIIPARLPGRRATAIVSQEIGHEGKAGTRRCTAARGYPEKFKALSTATRTRPHHVVGHDPTTDFVNGVLSGSPLAAVS